jgi:hypothetical protein
MVKPAKPNTRLVSSKTTRGKKLRKTICPSILLFSLLFYLLFSFISCSRHLDVQKLSVEKGRPFGRLSIKKVFEAQYSFLNACFPCPGGIILVEILDRSWSEFNLYLFDYSGNIKKQRTVQAGQGPNEFRAADYAASWISSDGKIYFIDMGDYLKTIDPETLEIATVSKLSNVIEEYGSHYNLGRLGLSSLEYSDGQIITSFESTGFPENFGYYIIKGDESFEDLSVITKAHKKEPWTWAKLKERENYIDYYGVLRLDRIFSADWKRQMIYYIPDIEKPEIERVDFAGKKEERLLIDIDYEKFPVDREELEAYQDYVSADTEAIIKNYYRQILYIPPHAPALMGLKVIDDWLLIITGHRNWETGENEVQVYSLPSLKYEGSFYLPFPSHLRTKWFGNYYCFKDMVGQDPDFPASFQVYKVEKRK